MRFTLISTIVATVGLGMAQLSGKVGPSTSREDKAAKKLCNILDHGGVASETTDNSMAITKAWESCKEGGQILIPDGKFGLGKWIELSGGKGLSLNLEGIIIRSGNGTAGESMITVQKTEDFEFYSASSKGAIQGYGFEFHERNSSGPGMLRLSEVTSFSVHDLALVDSPSFHLSVDRSANGEIFNLVVHGGDRAGLNGVDVSSTNIWVHDLEVSNGDDCVAVKSPASNVLIESIFCNLSGGCAVGPSGENTNITEIIYQNIYSQRCKHMLSIKSNGGSGFFNNAIFTNFTGHTNDDAINLDSKWQSQEPAPGEGVEYDYLDFTNWAGTCKNNKVPLIHLQCSPDILCGSLNVDSVNVWTEAGDSVSYVCENAYGMGACMNPFAGNGRYTSTTSVTSMAPTSYAITTMPAEITQGLGVTTSIDIPPVPTTYFPGLKPASTLLGKV